MPLRTYTTASNFAFVFVALTIVVAEMGGRAAAVVTALVSALSLDFFLTQPYMRLTIHEKHDVIDPRAGPDPARPRASGSRHLTRTEYNLLALLVKHAGKVLTHRQLLKEVWGPGSTGESHYLRVYMGQLPHKLERDPTRPRYLLTETGIGYRLKAD